MNFLYWLESLRNPFLDAVFSFFTHFGEEMIFLLLAVTLFWCVSKREGYYLMAVGFFGTVVNQTLKLIFRIPRPWVLDPDFTIVESARAEATGYSFPSGHTQNAVGTYGAVSLSFRRRWVRVVAISLAVIVPFSRLYLGVHTPLDVSVSVLVALLLVFGLYPLMHRKTHETLVTAILFSVGILLTFGALLFSLLFRFPADIDPVNLASGRENLAKLLGASVGLLIAYFVERKFVRFETRGVWYLQIFKVAVGALLCVGLKAGLKYPLNALFGEIAGGGVRYFLLILVAALLWPLTFAPLIRLTDGWEEKRRARRASAASGSAPAETPAQSGEEDDSATKK
ncbi:MAG: phosphatase PAP2 family protein [Clostridia bacterium]|nr:phosphatase PAP2 family protein [Clostridia bacterium]MDY6183830.1 phosphatase PAP2 family protein [Eubacteriales bacterium]